MSWLARLFRAEGELPAPLVERIDGWRRTPAASERAPFAEARFMVVDVETSGLDARRDRLLAIGAVAVERRRLLPGQGFEATLRAPVASARANILVHGITPDAQASGAAPEEALVQFLEYAGREVLVGFNAPFDQMVLDRALREHLGVRLPNPWIDVAQLAPALLPEARLSGRPLDDWLALFGLRAQSRHRAVFDAYATAELLLILLSRAAAAGLTSVSQLRAACEQQARFLPGGGARGV
jgi:DNA polymerase-3 subunit epsilon